MKKRQSSERRRRPRLADPIHRLTTRWRSGGVEKYPLGKDETNRALQRMGSGFEITHHHIRLEVLPEAFRGFRIIQLSDIHHGVFLPGEMLRQVVETVNELEPDLVAVTGDFVTYSRAYIEPVAEILAHVRAKNGVFAVLGNHDFRVGAEEISHSLEGAGIEVLRNTHTKLRRRGQSLYLAGIDDWHYRPDLARAIRGIPKDASTILLSHNPAIIRAAAKENIGLVLSGHTHGGQVNLPFLGTIWGRSPEQLRFKVGWAKLGHTQIYVSRGIGTIVLPLRFRCPAEIPYLALDSLHPAA
ncbi:MAG: metallophosphoesterase [Candidatus Acidiferrales bacterium]